MSRPPDLTDGKSPGAPRPEGPRVSQAKAPVLMREPQLKDTPRGRTLVAEPIPVLSERDHAALSTVRQTGNIPPPATSEAPLPVQPASLSEGERSDPGAPPEGIPLAFRPDGPEDIPEHAVNPATSAPDRELPEATFSTPASEATRIPVNITTIPLQFGTDPGHEELPQEQDLQEEHTSQTTTGEAVFTRADHMADPAPQEREVRTPQPEGTTHGSSQEAGEIQEQEPKIVFMGENSGTGHEDDRGARDQVVRAQTDPDHPERTPQEPQEPATSQAAQPQRTSAQEEPDQPPRPENTGSGARDGNDRPPADPGEAGRNGPEDNSNHTDAAAEISPRPTTKRTLNDLPAIPIQVAVFETKKEPAIEEGETRDQSIERLLREGFTNRAIAEAVRTSTSTVDHKRSALSLSEDIPVKGKIIDELDRLLQLGRYADEQIERDLGVSKDAIANHRRQLIEHGLKAPRITIRQASILVSEPERGNEATGPRRTTIAKEQLEAGNILNQLIERNQVSATDLAERLETDEIIINQFIQGEREFNLDAIYNAVIALGAKQKNEDYRENITRLNTLRRKQNWIRTLAPEEVTLGMALEYLLLEQRGSEELTGKHVPLPSHMDMYLLDQLTPYFYNLRKILTLRGIDPDSKEGQLFFLKAAKMTPQSIETFVRDSSANQVQGIRVRLGLNQREFAEILGHPKNVQQEIESGIRSLPDETIDRLADYMHIARDSALIRVIRKKAAGLDVRRLSPSDYDEILNGLVVFAEHQEQAMRTTAVDNDYEQITPYDTAYAAVTKLLAIKRITDINQLDIDKRTKESIQSMLENIRLQENAPDNKTLMLLLHALNYDSQDPMAQYLLDLARQERTADPDIAQRLQAIPARRLHHMKEVAYLRAIEHDASLWQDIPVEIKEIGTLLEDIRLTLKGSLPNGNSDSNDQRTLGMWEIAKYLNVSHVTFSKFIRGEAYIEPEKIYYAVDELYRRHADDSLVKLLAQRVLDFSVLRMLAQPGMTKERAMLLLRLSMGTTDEAFAEEGGMNAKTVMREAGKGILAYTQTQMLKTANVSDESRAAELFHLISSSTPILLLHEFIAASSGKKLRYWRKGKGYTLAQVGNEFYVSKLERDQIKSKELWEEFLERLFDGNVLRKAISPRDPVKQGLTEEEMIRLFQEGNVIFGEHMMQVTKYGYELSEAEDAIYQQIKTLDKISDIFATIRNNIKFTEIEAKGGGPAGSLGEIESGKRQPQYLTILHFCAALGYGFFHPITQEMLYKLWLAKNKSKTFLETKR